MMRTYFMDAPYSKIVVLRSLTAFTIIALADLEARVGLAVQSVAESEAVPAGSRARIHRL